MTVDFTKNSFPDSFGSSLPKEGDKWENQPPMWLGLGAGYNPIPDLRIMLSFNFYFDKDKKAVITLEDRGDGLLIADAVQLVPVRVNRNNGSR